MASINTHFHRRPRSEPALGTVSRPRAAGKFIFAGDEKIYIRGVTYGTFRPQVDGTDYPLPSIVEADFAQMADAGLNAVRTYTVPPTWLLDLAEKHGLRVMVGLPWEQHIAFLSDRDSSRSIEQRVREGVRTCAGHPAVLCYAIGNEIPASIVRWHGPIPIERFLRRLYHIAKVEDPGGLVTYVNYPTTEYLDLSFLDLVCFNVYLESREQLKAYLARLHNIAGERPLILAEVGLDSRRNGELAQAVSLDWQIRTAFAGGCAGLFVFAWTDEWHRSGHEIRDWDFGLTRRDRQPKPSLAAVRRALTQVPFPSGMPMPRVSVVVCTYNGARTLRECLDGISKLEYPDFETIVVNDGSTDATASVAREYGCRLINSENRGLSHARNLGLEAATGEIVAYLDDDAFPDPHWLSYLASTFLTTDHAAVGGPNIAVPDDGPIADCIANSPGSPTHVLLSDQEAEHIPGCNMAVRRSRLQAVGGFDPRYRVAGDDVDLCWRLREDGGTLGFNPSAVVWHHRRNSLRAYWRQQVGYGRAEALLQEKWPDKYNGAGHASWSGRIYESGPTRGLGWSRGRIYQGVWGTAPFQSLYQPNSGTLWSLPLMPEWNLVILALMAAFCLGLFWWPLLVLDLPLLVLALAAPVAQAVRSARAASFRHPPRSASERLKLRALIVLLYLLQPLARLQGRVGYSPAPWRLHRSSGPFLARRRDYTLWSEKWQAPQEWLQAAQAYLRAQRVPVLAGGQFDRWDLEVRGGLLGAARMLMAVEEHGSGRQLVRCRTWPVHRPPGLELAVLLFGLCGWAAVDEAWFVAVVLGLAAVALVLRTVQESATASAVLSDAFRRPQSGG